MENEYSTELAAMRAALDGFQLMTLDRLRLLVDELDVRASRVQGRNSYWDQQFREQWEALEEVYSVMADRSISTPDATLGNVIASAVDKLRVVLRENETSEGEEAG